MVLWPGSFCCDQKSRVVCAQSFALWQQATIEFTCHDHSIIACSRHVWCCSSSTSRSWWITHLTQRHRRGCNNIPSFLQRTSPISRSLCEGWTRHNLHILVTAPFRCDRKCLSGMCAKLRTVAARDNRVHAPQSFYYCLFEPRTHVVVLRAHLVCGESHIQRNSTGKVTTASSPFCNITAAHSRLKPTTMKVDSYLLRLVNRRVGWLKCFSLLLFAPWFCWLCLQSALR